MTSGVNQPASAPSERTTVSKKAVAVAILGILYILSPIDLAPELVLGPLGLIDDAGMLVPVLLALRRWQKGRSANG